MLGEAFRGGQRVAVGLGKRLGAVLGDLDWRGAVAQGVLGDRLVGAFAEHEADRRVVVLAGDPEESLDRLGAGNRAWGLGYFSRTG